MQDMFINFAYANKLHAQTEAINNLAAYTLSRAPTGNGIETTRNTLFLIIILQGLVHVA
jgi:hypothetical protein